MRYLLDTHVILWLAYEDAKISKTATEILLNEESDIFMSAVSFWEISLKYQAGKLDLKGHSPETLKAGFDLNFEFSELDLKLEDATTAKTSAFPRLRILHYSCRSHFPIRLK